MSLDALKASGEAPEWMTEEGYQTISRGYLASGETPRDMYRRVARAAAEKYPEHPELQQKFFDYMWNGWLCPATPVLTNMGTDRGLPISCVTGDVWLNTKSGGKQMADIEVGDEVLTHEGRWRKVVAKKSRMSTGDLFRIKVGTRVTWTKITGNHPVLTNEGWKRVDELNAKRHFVATSKHIDSVEEDYTIDMSKFVDYKTVLDEDGRLCKASESVRREGGIVSYYCKVPRFVQVTDDLAWAIGLWFAEGSKTVGANKKPNGIRITLGCHEKGFAQEWLRVMKESFNLNGNHYESSATRESFCNGKTTRWVSVNLNGGPVGNLFVKEFGENCKTKTIPEWIVNLPVPKLKKFMEGFLIGDGHFLPNGTWSATLANPKLLLGLYLISLKLGYDVSLQMQAKPSHLGTTKYVYLLRSLKTDDSIKLSRNNSLAGIDFGKLRYCPILALEKVEQDEEVFDITVEEDASFAVNGFIAHNCNSIHSDDSIISIFDKNTELAMLSKNGAGVGIYLGDVRGRGAPIKGNGKSEGVIPWCKIFDITTAAVSQGSARRGASAIYLPIEHLDIEEFLEIRKPTGDPNRRCLNINHGICVSDDWMASMLGGDQEKRRLWEKILYLRITTGEPYLFFTDTVNKANPEGYRNAGLSVSLSNLCSEITLYTDPDHTFVCCLSSLNLVKYEEWKDTDLVKDTVYFLDAVLEEYISKASDIPGFGPAIRSAQKGRAIGIGVLGWHTLLQKRGLPFDSFDSMKLNAEIFRTMRAKAEIGTSELALLRGEPEWCRGTGRRNTHLLAVAPTVSNSTIAGGHSAGIEPLAANIVTMKSAKGVFIRKNAELEAILEARGQNTSEVWKSISANSGSVQHLDCLDAETKAVFLTAREINQHAIIKQAAQRQRWIDQAQSVNLFFAVNAEPKYIHEVHIEAWKQGLKTLYYCRTEGVLRSDLASRSSTECVACEG